MIQEELLREGTLVRHWSDRYLMMLQTETGIKYGEAIDIVPCPYTYSEVSGEYVYPEWEEGRTYMREERVIFNESAYESVLDENTHSPAEGADFWRAL